MKKALLALLLLAVPLLSSSAEPEKSDSPPSKKNKLQTKDGVDDWARTRVTKAASVFGWWNVWASYNIGRDVYSPIYAPLTNHLALLDFRPSAVSVRLSDNVEKFVSKDTIKAQFELELRNSGIKLNTKDTDGYIELQIGAYETPDKLLDGFSYHAEISAIRRSYVMVNGPLGHQLSPIASPVYRKAQIGTTNSKVATETYLNAFKLTAPIFFNDFHKARDEMKRRKKTLKSETTGIDDNRSKPSKDDVKAKQ